MASPVARRRTPTSLAGSRSSRANAGFTLVEALASLALLAAAAAIIAPRVQGSIEMQAAKSDAGGLANFIAAARTHAMAARVETIVTLDTATNEYWSTQSPKPVAMRADTRLQLTTATTERTDASRGGVRFFPDGTSTGASVRVENRAGVTNISVHWLTGRVAVAFGR